MNGQGKLWWLCCARVTFLLPTLTLLRVIHTSNYSTIASISEKGKVYARAKWPIRPALITGFCSMKRLGVFLLPLGWDASPLQGYPHH